VNKDYHKIRYYNKQILPRRTVGSTATSDYTGNILENTI